METERRLPEIDLASVGPQLGAPFPDVVLPDQTGMPVDLHAVRGERRAVVVFHRSADW